MALRFMHSGFSTSVKIRLWAIHLLAKVLRLKVKYDSIPIGYHKPRKS